MTTIGFIGSGHIGSTLARLAVTAGYDVVLSNSRGPETLQELVAELGARARAATPAEAAAAGDLVVLTIPFKAYADVPAEPFAGKTVIDTNNYYPVRDGHFPELEDGSTTEGELIQRHLAKSRVVKAFNNIYWEHLAQLPRPAGAADRSAIAIAGDDAGAKAAVTAFLDRIGYDTVDAGPLAADRRFRSDTPAYGVPYGDGRTEFWASPPEPASADELRALLAQAGADAGSWGARLPEGYDHTTGRVRDATE
jgi:predicted dinucleotide-binding enzyme